MKGNPRKLPSGRWQVRFPAPDRHRETYDTWKEATAALNKARNQRDEGNYLAPKSIPTFREAAEEWLTGKAGKRPSTIAAWQVHLDVHVLPLIGHLRLDKITTATIEKKVRDVLRKSLGPKTVNKIITTTGAVFKLAVRRGYCVGNPVAAAERAANASHELVEGAGQPVGDSDVEVQPDEVLSAPEISRLFTAAEPGLYRTLIMTVAMTGWIRSEARAGRIPKVIAGRYVRFDPVEVQRSLKERDP